MNREAKQAKSKRVVSFCKVPYRGYANYSFLEWLGVSLKWNLFHMRLTKMAKNWLGPSKDIVSAKLPISAIKSYKPKKSFYVVEYIFTCVKRVKRYLIKKNP